MAATACGSSSKPSSASYVKQANAICATYDAKVTALAKPAGTATLAEVKKYLGEASSLLTQEDGKLTSLTQPSSSGSKYTSVYDQQKAEGTKLQAAATASSVSEIKAAVLSLQNGTGSLDAAFNSAGLTTCGSK